MTRKATLVRTCEVNGYPARLYRLDRPIRAGVDDWMFVFFIPSRPWGVIGNLWACGPEARLSFTFQHLEGPAPLPVLFRLQDIEELPPTEPL